MSAFSCQARSHSPNQHDLLHTRRANLLNAPESQIWRDTADRCRTPGSSLNLDFYDTNPPFLPLVNDAPWKHHNAIVAAIPPSIYPPALGGTPAWPGIFPGSLSHHAYSTRCRKMRHGRLYLPNDLSARPKRADPTTCYALRPLTTGMSFRRPMVPSALPLTKATRPP